MKYVIGQQYQSNSLFAGQLIIEVTDINEENNTVYFKIISDNTQDAHMMLGHSDNFYLTSALDKDLAPCTPAKKKKEAKPFENTATFDDLFKGG